MKLLVARKERLDSFEFTFNHFTVIFTAMGGNALIHRGALVEVQVKAPVFSFVFDVEMEAREKTIAVKAPDKAFDVGAGVDK